MDPSALEPDLEARDWNPRSGEPLRMAVVGLGFFSREAAIPAIREADGVTLSHLVTGSPGNAFGLGLPESAVLSYEEFNEGEQANAYDAVYVATPNAAHLSAVETAASLGKDVLTEKPLTASVETAGRAVEACEEAGVTLHVAYRMQFDPAVLWMKSLIEDGLVGDISLVTGGFSFPTLAMSGPDSWRLDRETAGGGALIDLGVYPINTTRYLLEREPVSVTALETAPSAAFEVMSAPAGDGVEENVGVLLDFDGTMGAFYASFNAEKTSSLAVVGTEGRLELDTAFEVNQARTIRYASGETTTTLSLPNTNEVRELFEYFGAAVADPQLTRADGQDGYRDLEIVDAAYATAEGESLTE